MGDLKKFTRTADPRDYILNPDGYPGDFERDINELENHDHSKRISKRMIYYLSVRFSQETNMLLSEFRLLNGLSNGVWPKLGFYTTISYSREPFEFTVKELQKRPIGFAGAIDNVQLFSTSLVLVYKSPLLDLMHDLTISSGATYDYPKYIPHITIIEDCKSIPPIKEMSIPIVLSEIFYMEWEES